MITIKSNIKQFLENYRKKVENLKVVLDNVAEKLAQKMCAFMALEISSLKYVWVEEGNLQDVKNIDFDIESIGTNSVRVSIGKNLTPFEMKDGTLVNPAFFIEFGFGIVGQNNPKQNHEAFDWEYNINGHTTAWYYKYNDEYYRSEGRQGINFMYNAQQKAKEFLMEILKEQANGWI